MPLRPSQVVFAAQCLCRNDYEWMCAIANGPVTGPKERL